jgi:fatty acid desaturase
VETFKPQVTAASYRSLSDEVRRAGLLDRRPAYYAAKITVTVAAYLVGWLVFVMVGNSWVTLYWAAGLAVLFTQVVFLGHDAGHNQISSSRRINQLLGLFTGNLLTGVSFGWWVPKHNAHHAHPNQPERDPDIGPGVLAFTFTSAEARRHTGIARLITRRQAALFVPLLILEGVGLHITSGDWLVRRGARKAAIEAVLLLAHFALYLTLVFVVLSPARALAFIAVQQGLFGLYLGCSFAPNHKGMPMVESDEEMTFVARQVITARNVRGGRYVDFLLGGLNRQIEHHLFPTMCRPNLARAQPLVRAFCSEQGLPYTETGLIASYRLALHHLSAISQHAKLSPLGAQGV